MLAHIDFTFLMLEMRLIEVWRMHTKYDLCGHFIAVSYEAIHIDNGVG